MILTFSSTHRLTGGFAKLALAAAVLGPPSAAAQTLPGPLPTDFGAFLTPQLEGGSRYRVAVGADMAYDNNIYRVPGSTGRVTVRPNETYSNSAWISRHYAQGNLDLPVSRQRFLGQVTGSVYQFQGHSYLDYGALNYRAGWLWEAGDSLKGVLRYDRQRGLADFIDVRPISKNVRTYENWLGSGEFLVTPRWVLTGGISGYSAINGDSGYATGDLRERKSEGGIKYTATGSTYIRGYYSMADGRYPNRVQTATVDDQYEQREVGMELRYEITEATNFVGRYGRVKREFPDVPRNNQENPSWRIDFNWAYSAKTSINFNTRKEYGVFEFVDPRNAAVILTAPSLSTVHGVAPTWEISPALRIEYTYERWTRDFSSVSSSRKDKLEFARLSLRWTPDRNWLGRVGVLGSLRDSTDDFFDFRDRVWYGTVEYKF